MKPTELLLEADAKLLNFMANQPNFEQRGSAAVFLYDDAVLAKLLKHGGNAGSDLKRLSTPAKNQQGLGVVDKSTGTIWVGAIDDAYEVYWASSLGSEPEFFRGKLIKDLSNRLQELAEIFASSDETPETGAYTPKGSGVERVIDFIKNSTDPDYSGIPKELLDTDINDLDELERKFKETLKNLKAEVSIKQKQRKKILDIINAWGNDNPSATEIPDDIDSLMKQAREFDSSDIEFSISDLESFLKNEKDLFDESDEDEDEDEQEDQDPTESVNDRLTAWQADFEAEYPELNIDNVRDFDPNQ